MNNLLLINKKLDEQAKTNNAINSKEIFSKLLKKGHSIDRATIIIKEAEQSSNPNYILHYWGIKTKVQS